MTTIARHSAAGISYLRCEGGGPMPIVLLHGIGSNAQSFEPLMKALDARLPVLAWDAPGYGDSKPLKLEWPDASDYAAALDRLLFDLNISALRARRAFARLADGRAFRADSQRQWRRWP